MKNKRFHFNTLYRDSTEFIGNESICDGEKIARSKKVFDWFTGFKSSILVHSISNHLLWSK